jgi:hypothetical protein
VFGSPRATARDLLQQLRDVGVEESLQPPRDRTSID